MGDHVKTVRYDHRVLVLSGCTHSTVLVNPRTGERVTCRAPTDQSGIIAIDPTGRREIACSNMRRRGLFRRITWHRSNGTISIPRHKR